MIWNFKLPHHHHYHLLVDLIIIAAEVEADHLIDHLAPHHHHPLLHDVGQNLDLFQDLDHLVVDITNLKVDVDLIHDHHHVVAIIHLHHQGLVHAIPLPLVNLYQFLILFNLISNLFQIKI